MSVERSHDHQMRRRAKPFGLSGCQQRADSRNRFGEGGTSKKAWQDGAWG
jgi:hypothetical protein